MGKERHIMVNDMECSICYFIGEVTDIEDDKSKCRRVKTCPNCGAKYLTDYDKKSGGSITSLYYNPGADYSTTAMFRIIAGAILFGVGCWKGLGYGGASFGLIGAGILAWGLYDKHDTIAKSKTTKRFYPHWNK
jgi:hypothetical protein